MATPVTWRPPPYKRATAPSTAKRGLPSLWICCENAIYSCRTASIARNVLGKCRAIKPKRSCLAAQKQYHYSSLALCCNILAHRRLRCDGGVVKKAKPIPCREASLGSASTPAWPRQAGQSSRCSAERQRENVHGGVSAVTSASNRCEPLR